LHLQVLAPSKLAVAEAVAVLVVWEQILEVRHTLAVLVELEEQVGLVEMVALEAMVNAEELTMLVELET
jgi:hypothetical protein